MVKENELDKFDREVLEQSIMFREKLGELPVELAGKWVVFKGGEVSSKHENASDAYETAIREYGVDAPYVVAQVKSDDPTPVSAGVLFGYE